MLGWWLLIGFFCQYQHIKNGYIDFAQSKYVPGEWWLGLEALHRITSQRYYKLRITLKDFDDKTYVAVYDKFKVLIKTSQEFQMLQVTIWL